MKNTILPIAIAGLLLAGCSSAYKTGQTPDDVYYSSNPAVVAAEIQEKPTARNDYESYWANPDDDYLRMKVQKGGRWNNIDDIDYWYGYNGGCQCNSNWSLYNGYNNMMYNPWGLNSLGYSYGYNPWAWNNMYYNGYYGGLFGSFYGTGYYPVIITSKYPTAYSNPSRPSLRGYGNTQYGNSGSGNRRMSTSSAPGSGYRSIFGGSNSGNSSSGSYDRPARTFEPSSSGSSSGSSRSSGGGSSSGGSSSGGSSSSGSSRGGRGG
jgi:hypothetical protein